MIIYITLYRRAHVSGWCSGMGLSLTPIELLVMLLFTIIASWSVYHFPIAFSGLLGFRRGRAPRDDDGISYTPRVSVIVPVKNGARVLDRLMASLLSVDYPKERMEVILVEDGSTDGSYELCKHYEKRFPELVRVIHRERSRGKPDALSCGTSLASGEILAIFDVDSVVNPAAFKLALRHFDDPRVAAVQGRTISMNSRDSLLSWLVYLEECWFSAILVGRHRLNLFTPLTGSCMFIRKSSLEKIGGWNCDSLTEDVELAIRLVKHDYMIVYEKEAMSFQEAPTRLKHLALQRNRWYRGYMETLVKNLHVLKKFSLRIFDACILLLSPIIALLGQIFYPLTISAAVLISSSPLIQLILQLSLTPLIISLAAFMIAVFLLVKPREARFLLLAPMIYAYWCFLSIIALKSCADILIGSPRQWITTPKEGCVWPLSRRVG